MKVRMNKMATKKSENMLKEIMSNVDNISDYSDNDLLLANTCLAKKNNIESLDKKIHRLCVYGSKLWKYPSKYDKTLTEDDDLVFVCGNGKTGVSIDFRNDCEYNCSYCYVNSKHARLRMKKSWQVDASYLTPRREKRFRLFLNWFKENFPKNYPLRFFSLADCMDSDIGLLQKLLRVCKEESVNTIVITKNENAAISAYNLATSVLYSVDNGNYNSPTSLERYIELNKQYPKLRMFAMVVDFNDLKYFQDAIEKHGLTTYQFVAYHGPQNMVCSSIETIIKPSFLNILTNGKACCSTTNRCIGCHLMCGINEKISDNYSLYRYEVKK